eukprot:m.340409 g.340409  ORF g.340409 m.340409 type:complete len:152 (+) comp19278_c0_seq1:184-639(+)
MAKSKSGKKSKEKTPVPQETLKDEAQEEEDKAIKAELLRKEAVSEAGKIVSSLLDTSLNQIHDLIISEKANKYSALRCKEAVSVVVETNFLHRDVGEPGIETDSTWKAGEEPPQSTMDSWGRGTIHTIEKRTIKPETIVNLVELSQGKNNS